MIESNAKRIDPAMRQSESFPEPLYSVLRTAISERATDIHFDSTPAGETVRFRVDGILHTKELITAEQSGRIINQIKVAANLSPERTFRPLESNMKLQGEWGRYNIRVSIIPVGTHESAHLRLLTADRRSLDIEALGLCAENSQQLTEVLQRGHGLILIAGGTGSGKTTTMYALANALDLQKNVVVSVEDPVEFRFPHIRQLAVDENHGLDMQDALRVLLRMDPDAILIGEIRDQNSATTAARAALAGRLVIATIHATDAAMAVDALKHYSVPRYVLSGALRLVINQDLLRRVCLKCAGKRPPSPSEKRVFEASGISTPATVVEAVGCRECDDYGYVGRIGIFELTSITAAMADEISRGGSQQAFREIAASQGPDMLVDALRKAAQGTISIGETLDLHFSRTTPTGERRL